MNKEKVYIGLESKYSVDINTDVYIKDIGKVYCKDIKVKKDIENLVVFKRKSEEDWDYIDDIKIIKSILEYNPDLDINLMGASEVIIEIKSKEKANQLFEVLKIAFVSILLFFGAAIAIINFHEDVNMLKSLEKIYFTFTGIQDKNPKIMTIPYSIGLGIGVLVFFNRVISSSKRRKKEPGPMEIQLYLYDGEMEQLILNDLKKNK